MKQSHMMLPWSPSQRAVGRSRAMKPGSHSAGMPNHVPDATPQAIVAHEKTSSSVEMARTPACSEAASFLRTANQTASSSRP